MIKWHALLAGLQVLRETLKPQHLNKVTTDDQVLVVQGSQSLLAVLGRRILKPLFAFLKVSVNCGLGDKPAKDFTWPSWMRK